MKVPGRGAGSCMGIDKEESILQGGQFIEAEAEYPE